MAWLAEELLTAIGQAAPQDCITRAALILLTDLNDKQVDNATRKLRKHGLLDLTGPGCYRLTAAGTAALSAGKTLRSGPQGSGQPRKRVWQSTLRIRVWRAIRIRRKFSIPDLEMLAAQGDEKDIGSNIGKYLRALERAGYLVKLPKREAGTALTSNGFMRWWLPDEKDTGPKAPVIRSARKTLYDPNLEQEVPLCG